MGLRGWIWLFIVFTCMFLDVAVSQNKINVPRVLLPRATDIVTNFTLKVTDGGELGCFRWESSRTDVATVTAIPENDGPIDCSAAAVVSALSKSDQRLTSIVWAEHITSKERFRCDIIVDTINSIEIVTTTLELFLEDAPEAFEIRAKDSKGDTFSALDGLEVDWKISNDRRNDSVFMDAHNILRITKFADTQYKPPTSIFAMEASGKRGFMVLVEGLQTGSAIVTAALKHSAFRTVEPAEVRIVVVANLILQPPHDIYLMQFGSIHYSVQQIKQARSFDIDMPSKQYYLELRDESRCMLDERTTTVTCMELGDTEIVLKDRNMKETDAHHPSAAIHVVEPAYMNLVILPGRNWVLQRGGKYEVIAELYDRDSHLIYSSNNVRIRMKFPAEFFDILYATTNGSHQNVLAKKIGKTEISAELSAVVLPDGKLWTFDRIIAKPQIVEIHEQVVVSPKRLLFPFQPETSQTYQTSLSARGGSGNFTWTSMDTSVVSVDRNSGRVKAGLKEGSATVKAVDLKNSLHWDSAEIYVVPVADLVVLPSPREVEVNKTLVLPIALRGRIPGVSEPQAFHDCRQLNLHISISDNTIVTHSIVSPTQQLQPGSCSSVAVHGVKPGFTSLTISYLVGDTVVASQQVTIAAYNPLKNVETDGVALLTIGSSKLFNFKGGPAPWIHEPASHRIALGDSPHGVVTSRTVGGSALSTLREVSCVKLGEETLVLEVKNLPSKTNPVPAVSKIDFKVICAAPARLEMKPKVVRTSAIGLPLCPWRPDSAEPFPVLHNSELDLHISVFDAANRAFYNFSSLLFDWDVSDSKLISVKSNDGFVFPWHQDSALTEEKHPNHKLVSVHSGTGKASITATVNGYRRESLHAVKSPEHTRLDHKLATAVNVVVVEQPKFNKASLSVFNHPANKEVVSISDGSGFFHLVASNPQLAKVTYDLKSRNVAILPHADGSLVVTAYDVCTAAKPIEIPVTVAGLDRIELLVGDKVEKGKVIRMLVRVFDSAHKPLSQKLYSLIDLKPSLSSNFVSLKEEPSPVDKLYTVHGNSVGRVSVSFRGTTGGGSEVLSKPMDIQVFLPLRIDPKNVTLIPTAKFQVLVHGGPQPQNSVVFTIKKSLIASIDTQSGLMEAVRLGSTVVVAQIVDFDPVSGKEEVYSQDEAEVHVVSLTGLRIRAAVRVLEVGTELPLEAMGLNEQETPFSFGGVVPALRFDWTVDNVDVAELTSFYSQNKATSIVLSYFSPVLRALNQGTVMVRLKLVGAVGNLQTATDLLRVRVVEPLRLVGLGCGATLLITPHTTASLKTTRDGEAKMTYRVVHGGDVLQVDSQGQISTEDRLGEAVVEITSVEPDLSRTIAVSVQVKETSFLKVRLISSVGSEDGLEALPIGVAVQLATTFHDELGRAFFATNTMLKYRANRNDFLHITWSRDQNNTLVARPVKAGETVVKVWDSVRPSVSDFIGLRGAPVIVPSEHEAAVGEIICYTCPLVTTDGRRGRWTSSSSNVFISKDSGLAIAVAPGKATIYYNVSADVVSRAEIAVKPLEQLRFGSHLLEHALTNADSKSPLIVPVTFGRGDTSCTDFDVGTFTEAAKRLWDVEKDLFRCSVEFDTVHPNGITAEDVFSVVSDVNGNTGQFGCVIGPKANIRHLDEELSTFEAAVLLTVRSVKGSQEPEVLKIDFLPAFYIQTPEVHLNHIQVDSSVVISATAAVHRCLMVKPVDSGIVEVGSATLENKANTWSYPVKLLTGPNLTVRLQSASPRLTVECRKTDQHASIPLKIQYIAETGRGSSYPSTSPDYWLYVIPALIMTAILSIAWLLWHFYQQSVQDRQYLQYLAASGQNPALVARTFNSNSGSPRRSAGSSFTTRTPSPTRQSYLGPSPGMVWKQEPLSVDDTTDITIPRMWSTSRALPNVNSVNRRSPQ